jgi:hypothetical protein
MCGLVLSIFIGCSEQTDWVAHHFEPNAQIYSPLLLEDKFMNHDVGIGSYHPLQSITQISFVLK